MADDNIRPVTLPPLAMREMARLAVLFSSTKGALEGLASLVEEAKGTGERGVERGEGKISRRKKYATGLAGA